jgi:hypothetical protein
VSSANDGTTPPQVIVKFGDLDISTSKGAAALHDRIQTAAVDVCSRMYVIEQAYQVAQGCLLAKSHRRRGDKGQSPWLSAVFASIYGVLPPMVLAAAEAR